MSSTDPATAATLIDYSRSVVLECDPESWAVTAAAADGTVSLWLYRPDAPENAVDGCSCARCAPHEQLGPLPRSMRENLSQPRCGHPRADGKPCRALVREAGKPCHHHRIPRR